MPARPSVFDRTNRELRTNRFYFAAHEDDVEEIAWYEDIDIGTEISEGDKLAEIYYSEVGLEILVAPPFCNGVVKRLKNPISVTSLTSLSQYLLSLERA